MSEMTINAPGTTGGPCTHFCGHGQCMRLAALASANCIECGRPIGYDTPFVDVTEKSDDQDRLLHVACKHAYRHRTHGLALIRRAKKGPDREIARWYGESIGAQVLSMTSNKDTSTFNLYLVDDNDTRYAIGGSVTAMERAAIMILDMIARNKPHWEIVTCGHCGDWIDTEWPHGSFRQEQQPDGTYQFFHQLCRSHKGDR